MIYTIHTTVTAPNEMYHAVHAELLKRSGGAIDGLLVHLAWPTPTGFRIVEVWTSKQARDQCEKELVEPARMAVTGPAPAQPGLVPQITTEELELNGLIIPAANIAK